MQVVRHLKAPPSFRWKQKAPPASIHHQNLQVPHRTERLTLIKQKMERTLTLFFATLVVLVTSGVQAQLSYATNTTVNVTGTGCGSSKLCVDTPSGCDPTGNSSCFFGSIKVKNVTTNQFSFQLSGNSTGYVALGLTVNSSAGSTLLFACARKASNNASIIFLTSLMNNAGGNLTQGNAMVTEIRGLVNNNQIQCEFDVSGLNATNSTFLKSSQDTSYVIILGSGQLNNDGSLGTLTKILSSPTLDLSNPSANVASTTTAPTSTTATTHTTTSGTDRALFSEGVLLLMGVLSQFVLKMA
ncbi:putative ferric-chelate reductase 1 [Nematolebias whitei]|uniref:putative ferric-chelate reductase 1 n=1 Tax=Nematolebias whitei TaxID=451745 RepID=UPI00189B4D28|nr:putative ferric-chelate reductase 1 [Nematolebias whitei]